MYFLSSSQRILVLTNTRYRIRRSIMAHLVYHTLHTWQSQNVSINNTITSKKNKYFWENHMLSLFSPPPFMVVVYTVRTYSHCLTILYHFNLYLVVVLKINYIKCLPQVLMLISFRHFVIWVSFLVGSWERAQRKNLPSFLYVFYYLCILFFLFLNVLIFSFFLFLTCFY